MSGIKNFVPAIRCCVAAVFLLLATAPAVIAQVNTTALDVPVEIRLTPDKNTIMVGEPLFLAFEVTNLSGEKLCLGVGGDYRNRFGRPDSFQVVVKGEDGKQLPKIDLLNMGGFVGCEPIEPGATYTVRLFLPHWATIERAGGYRVNATRHMSLSNYQPGESRRPKYTMLADINAEITVVPADENKMGGLINSLGSIMLDASDPRAFESATALVSIHDKRTISYFAEAVRKFRDLVFDSFPDREYYIAARAIEALAKYDDDRAIEALRSAMNSRSEETRSNVAYALAHSPHKSAVTLLLKMQDDQYWAVRFKVAQRLKDVKTKEAQAALQKLLKDRVEHVRNAAKESLN
ncbi:MAG TPA: HEAT repeat domain-containing protein [Pyrinomonadaceae bacterium]|nr:HEAT repeat domain-containing protein [Pyrinomonadaceae bacterium]